MHVNQAHLHAFMQNSEFLQSIGVIAFNEVYIFHLISALSPLFLIRFIIMRGIIVIIIITTTVIDTIMITVIVISVLSLLLFLFLFPLLFLGFIIAFKRIVLSLSRKCQVPQSSLADVSRRPECSLPERLIIRGRDKLPFGLPLATLGVSSEPFSHKLRASNLVKRGPSETPGGAACCSRGAFSPRCRRLFQGG